MRLSNRQSAELALHRSSTELDPESVSEVRDVLALLGILRGADDELLSMTLDAHRRPMNPYANT
ncbi:hypothetical protein AB5J52_12905 [Streptomyces sp. R39]|uniref:Uncharacterized protein n=1 Tax=Streptomyces sp. R39 TaxID=3238631 RepID=A0AB39QNN8_9ACTN